MDGKRQKALVASLIASIMIGTLLWVVGTQSSAAAPSAVAYPDQRHALEAAAGWLVRENQNEDGGYGTNFSTGSAESNVGATLDAVLALSSAGYNAAAPYFGEGHTPISYLESRGETLLTFAESNGGGAAKVILALAAANQNPRDFAGNDWISTLTSQYQPGGQYNVPDAYNNALAILALVTVNEPVPEAAVQWLLAQQAADGSWDDGYGTPRNPDATAMAVMALIATGRAAGDPALSDALQFLADSQLPSGGWEYGSGFQENANSTALVIQALAAAGEAFYAGNGPWAKGGKSPLEALLAWQQQNGAFQADFGQGPTDNFFATVQAIPAVAGRAYPLPARYEAALKGVSCLALLQDEQSGGWEQFAGFGINAGGTARAVTAIAAAGEDPQDGMWKPGSISALEALEALTPAYLDEGRGGRAGVVLQGVVAAGDPYDPNDFAGFDLPLQISGYLSPTGEYDDTSFGPAGHAEAMLGLLDAGAGVAPAAVDFLLDAHVDGDWGGPDSNGISLNALGRLGITVPEAITHLRSNQALDGGWGFALPSDPSSTSEVVQGLVQQGRNPFAPSWSKVVAGVVTNAADVVIGQQRENGCWYSPFAAADDPFGTTDAIILLAQQPGWERYDTFLPLATRP